MDQLRLFALVFVQQVRIGLGQQDPIVLMSEPARHGVDVNFAHECHAGEVMAAQVAGKVLHLGGGPGFADGIVERDGVKILMLVSLGAGEQEFTPILQ